VKDVLAEIVANCVKLHQSWWFTRNVYVQFERRTEASASARLLRPDKDVRRDDVICFDPGRESKRYATAEQIAEFACELPAFHN